MVQFINPPTSAFRGVARRPNPLASAIVIPARVNRQANALREVLSAQNSIFSTLPKEDQERIARNIVRAGPRLTQASLSAFPRLELEETEGTPEASGPSVAEKIGNLFSSSQSDENTVTPPSLRGGAFSDLLSGPERDTKPDNVDSGSFETGVAIRESLPSAISRGVDFVTRDVPGAVEATKRNVLGEVQDVSVNMENLIRGLTGLDPVQNENEPLIRRLLELDTLESVGGDVKSIRRGFKEAGITDVGKNESGPGSAVVLSNVIRKIRTDRRFRGLDLSPSKLKQDAKERGITVKQLINEIADAVGLTPEEKRRRFSGVSGSF